MTNMTSTHTSKVNWKTYRISCRIEKDADDRNYVWVVGTINGKDTLRDNRFNGREDVAKGIAWMMNHSLPSYLDGHHHETHYPEGFFA